jgi:hypothetical protein
MKQIAKRLSRDHFLRDWNFAIPYHNGRNLKFAFVVTPGHSFHKFIAGGKRSTARTVSEWVKRMSYQRLCCFGPKVDWGHRHGLSFIQ